MVNKFIHTFLDFIGLSLDKKIARMIRRGDVRSLLRFYAGEDETPRTRARDSLIDMAYSGKIPEEYRESVLDTLDPEVRIRERLRIRSLPSVTEILEVVSNEYLPGRNFKEAHYALEYALECKPGNPNILNTRAILYSHEENFEAARALWRKILEENPGDKTARELLPDSLTWEAHGLFSQSPSDPNIETLLSEALAVNGTYVEASYLLAKFYDSNSFREKALEMYIRILEAERIPRTFSNPRRFYGEIYQSIADIHREAGRELEASHYRKYAGKLLGIDEESPQVPH